MTRFVIAALSASIWLAGAHAAMAHAHLVSAVPAEGKSVAVAPRELRLNFSEGLAIKLSGVGLRGPGNAAQPIGTPALAKGTDKVLVVPLTTPLAAGTYEVEWHALSKDGHTTHGSYRFTVSP